MIFYLLENPDAVIIYYDLRLDAALHDKHLQLLGSGVIYDIVDHLTEGVLPNLPDIGRQICQMRLEASVEHLNIALKLALGAPEAV